MENLKEKGLQGEMYKRLNYLQKEIETLKERFSTNKQALKIYTENEKEALQKVGQKLKEEQSRIRRDLKVSEEAPGLFGFDDFFSKQKYVFSKNIQSITIQKEIKSVFNNPKSVLFDDSGYNIIGYSNKERFLIIQFSFNQDSKLLVNSFIFATEPLIKKRYCNA